MPPALGQGGGGRRLLGRGGGQDGDREVVHRLRLHPARRRDQRHLRGLGHGLPPARGVTDPPRPPSGSPPTPPAPLSPHYAPRGPEGCGGGPPARLRHAWSRLRQPRPSLPNAVTTSTPTMTTSPQPNGPPSTHGCRVPTSPPMTPKVLPMTRGCIQVNHGHGYPTPRCLRQRWPSLPNAMAPTSTTTTSTQPHDIYANHDHIYPSSWPCLRQPLDLYFNHDLNYPTP